MQTVDLTGNRTVRRALRVLPIVGLGGALVLMWAAQASTANTSPATAPVAPATQPVVSVDTLMRAQASAYLADVRQGIQAIESQLARIDQLEQTIAAMTPNLADRGAARKGDVNGDGKRDAMDLRVWYCCSGISVSGPNSACWFADMDGSGKIDSSDLTLLNQAIVAAK